MSEDGAPRTVFAANPGGRLGKPDPGVARSADGRAPAPRGDRGDRSDRRFGVNPLVDAAGRLLELAIYLRTQRRPMDIGPLRARAHVEIEDFRRRASAAGVEPKTAMRAQYAICATLDDVVLSSQWGRDSGWARNTLVSTLHKEMSGGDRFFELLEGVQRDPVHNKDLLELMYICLSLGFEGRFRRDRAALGAIEAHRSRLYQDIDGLRNGLTESLSVRWKGVETARKPARDLFSPWIVGALAMALVVAMALVARGGIDAAVAQPMARSLDAPPVVLARIDRPALIARPAPLAAPPEPPVVDRLTVLFDDLIAAGAIDVPVVEGSWMRIRVNSRTADGRVMFESGSAVVEPDYRAILQRIGEEIVAETGPSRIDLQGYSDRHPMRGTGRYRDNRHLSKERALSAARIMHPAVSPGGYTLTVQGFGEAVQNLIDRGATPEADARNRRIEILLPVQQPDPDATRDREETRP